MDRVEPEGAALAANLHRHRVAVREGIVEGGEEHRRQRIADLHAERSPDRRARLVAVPEGALGRQAQDGVRVAVGEALDDLGRGHVRAVQVVDAELGNVDGQDRERLPLVRDLDRSGRRLGAGLDELFERRRGNAVADRDITQGRPDGRARLVGVGQPAVLGHAQDRVRVLAGESVDRIDLALEQVRGRRRVTALDPDRDNTRCQRDDEGNQVAHGELRQRGARHADEG